MVGNAPPLWLACYSHMIPGRPVPALISVISAPVPRFRAMSFRMASDTAVDANAATDSVRSGNVAIIGGGPSGLVAANCMLAAGLQPTVIDASIQIGGMWAPDSGHGWSSLRTNISKFSCSFSDLWWETEAPMFPSKTQMHNYLSRYHARSLTHMKSPGLSLTRARVQSIKKEDSGRWKVSWSAGPTSDPPQSHSADEAIFDSVVIASGFFSEPKLPDIPGLHDFHGEVLHSCQYQARFLNKRVAVVGSSFSAVEIAAEIAPKASSLIHVTPHPSWILPRYIPISQSPDSPFFPLDLVFYRRKQPGTSTEQLFRTADENTNLHSYFKSLSGLPSHLIPPTLHPDPSTPPSVVVSDSYPEMLASGLIQVVHGRVVKVTEEGLQLSDQSAINNLDAIIFCTGYKTDLSFLPDDIKQAIELDPEDAFVPFLAHRSVFPTTFLNLAFVGMYRGTYYGVVEAQARWAAAVFSGKLPPPTPAEVHEGVVREREIRDRRPRSPFPHSDYVGFMDELYGMVGRVPEEKHLRQGAMVLPAHFAERGVDAESALKDLEESCEKFRGGLGMAAAVFRGLQGKWSFRRRIENRLPEPSASVEGTATFGLSSLPGDTGGDFGQERVSCMYEEEGVLNMNQVLRKCTQQYRYELEEGAGTLRVFFTTGMSVGKLFHGFRFFTEGGNWAASGHHPCGNDTYEVKYQFCFRGCYLASFIVEYNVLGPHKDYTSTTEFERRAVMS